MNTNCQKFTQDILKILEIENPIQGKVKKVVDSLSTTEAQVIH